MTKIVLKTPDNKRVVVDTKKDDCLYDAPRNPPNTGTRYTRGTDYYAHRTRKGNLFFYEVGWSMWQGDEGSVSLITKDELEHALLSKVGASYWQRLTDGKIERIKEEYGIDLLKETA